MNKLAIWYNNLDMNRKKQITAAGITFSIIALVLVAFVVFVPKKVTVTYGTIVRDPVDGHVWENNTKTKTVSSKDADKYAIKYVDKLSEESQKKVDEEKAQEEAEAQQQAQGSQGLEDVPIVLTEGQVKDIQTIQSNISKIGPQVITGFQMTQGLEQTKNSLVNYRNQLAGVSVPGEIEGMKQTAIQVFDKLIRSCDLYISAIANADISAFEQANALINEAFTQMMQIAPTWPGQ